MENAVNALRENCVVGITANAERTREMVLNSLGIVTLLKPVLGYKQCAEIAREGYTQGKSLHQIVVQREEAAHPGEVGRDLLVREPDPPDVLQVAAPPSVAALARGFAMTI